MTHSLSKISGPSYLIVCSEIVLITKQHSSLELNYQGVSLILQKCNPIESDSSPDPASQRTTSLKMDGSIERSTKWMQCTRNRKPKTYLWHLSMQYTSSLNTVPHRTPRPQRPTLWSFQCCQPTAECTCRAWRRSALPSWTVARTSVNIAIIKRQLQLRPPWLR